MSASSSPSNPAQLERRLGPFDAAAIIVSNVIGGGILFTPPQVAAAAASGPLFLLTWIVGGLLAFAGAMAYAELASVRPRAGGEYVYLRDAYGPLWAFLTGWTSFVAGFSGAIATSAVVLASYLGRFLPGAGESSAFLALPLVPGVVVVTLSPQTVVALVAIWGLALVHIRGLGPGRVLGNSLAALKVGALVLFVALGFTLGSGEISHLTAPGGGTGAPAGWLLALIPVMFTYSGWNAAAYVAEEIAEPARNLPRALALGTAAVVVIYACMNALYLYVFPVDELAAIRGSVLDVIADRLLGAAAGNVMGVVSIISLLASISAMTLAGPRVYFAMARDGAFLARAAAVHPRYRTPVAAIVAQALWSSVLVLTAGADTLVNYTGFAIVLFSGAAVLALFVLRRRDSAAARPFSAWGYPVAPAVFVVVSGIILVNGVLAAPTPTLAGVGVIALGVPLYLLFRRPSRTA